MPPIIIHDFDPQEGDRIELSPSFAIYHGSLAIFRDSGITFDLLNYRTHSLN